MEKTKEVTSIVSQARFHTTQTANFISAVFSVNPDIKNVVNNRISGLTNLDLENLFDDNETLCNVLYRNGYIVLNTNFDWKVSRWIEEVSKTNGFKDFLSFIKNRLNFIKTLYKNQQIIIRDLWPGDGHFINQIQRELKNEDSIIYWIWDKIYIDLYTSIKESYLGKKIPENIIKLFVKKFIDLRESIESNQSKFSDIITEICKNINLWENDILFQDSMFSEETTMFSHNKWFGLDKNSKDFLKSKSGNNLINELKQNLKKIILSNIDNSLQNIFISNFTDFRDNSIYVEWASKINKSHIQFATRSTSHLNNQDYLNFLDDYIKYLSFDGSIFVDNWVQMSYTMITRLEELRQLQEKYGDEISINLVYNENLYNFASVIIEKKPFGENIEKELDSNFKLISLEEASKDLLFQIDYIIREYLWNILWEIYNDYVIFSEINPDINQLVENCCKNYVHLEYTKYNILCVLEKIFHKFLSIIENTSRKNPNETINLLAKYHKARKIAIWNLTKIVERIYVCEWKDIFTTSITQNKLNNLRIKDLQEQFMKLQLETESRLGNIMERVHTTEKISNKDTFETKNLLSYVLPLIDILSEEKDNIVSEEIRNLLNLALKEKNKIDNSSTQQTRIDKTDIIETKEKFWTNAKILIAEDQIAIRRIVKTGLEKTLNCKSKNITVVENGIEAIEMIRLYPKKFDFILMDIQMPLKNGKEATEYIRKKLKNPIKIIAFTAEDTTREELIAIGFDDYVEKPCPIKKLKVKVEKVCGIGKESKTI